MPNPNYTVIDLVRVLAALFLYIPILCAPGYVLGFWMNLFAFREQRLLGKILIAVPLSIAIVPALLFVTLAEFPAAAVWAGFGALGLGFAALSIRDASGEFRRGWSWREWRWPAVVAALWIALGLFTMLDLQVGDRLYMAAPSFDVAIRAEFTHAATVYGARPPNPFFYPGHHVPLRYHYFWFLVCSLIERWSRGWIDPRQAILAGTLWCGLGLMALVYLCTRHFYPGGRKAAQPWIGIGLLWVIGADMIPVGLCAAFGVVMFSPELWNNEIAGWLHSLTWAPHAVAAVIQCFIGFLAVWAMERQPRYRKLIARGILAGVAFGSATGTSIYVTAVFAVSIALWLALCAWKHWYREAAAFATSGICAALVVWPYLHGLADAGGYTPNSSFIVPTIRSFKPVAILAKGTWAATPWVLHLLNGVFLPVNYAVELGFFAVIVVLQFKRYCRKWPNLKRAELASATLVLATAFVCTFFRSSVISNNDLGWRGFLIAQFVWVLWSIDYIPVWLRLRRMRKPALTPRLFRLRGRIAFLLAIGLLGTMWEAIIARSYLPIVDSGVVAMPGWLGPDRVIGERTLALREAYAWIDRRFPESAVILQNPRPYPDIYSGNFANRQLAAEDTGCGSSFGGDPRLCRAMLPPLRILFDKPKRANTVDLAELCRLYGIDAIVVKDNDPSWQNPRSWVWKERPIYRNSFARVFACVLPAAEVAGAPKQPLLARARRVK
jgi:hypothetical protein